MASSAALQASAALKSRVRRPSLLKKLAHPEDLLSYFPHGAYVGWSGFTGVGYPKYVFPQQGRFGLQSGQIRPPPNIISSSASAMGLFIVMEKILT